MPLVYVIFSPDMRCYVGTTTESLPARMRFHKWASKADAGHPLFGQAWDGLKKVVAFKGSHQACYEIETFLVKELNSFSNGFNKTASGKSGGQHGIKMPASHRKAISAFRKGRPRTDAEKVAIREGIHRARETKS